MVKHLCLYAAVVLALSYVLPPLAPGQEASFVEEKKLAVRLAAEARDLVGQGLLGEEYTEITTTVGHKDAKLLSAAPDFPALLAQWYKEAGVREGDAVAINASGSFPALNIAALAAAQAVKARPLLISSLGASSWGANRPDYTWAHMEQRLVSRWPAYASLAMSLGGDGDTAQSLPDEGRQALLDALRLSGAPVLTPESPKDIMAARMRLWKEHNGGELPALLVNIGGNHAFWGSYGRDVPGKEGLLPPNSASNYGDGVGKQFSKAGRPVIHLLGIKKIAAQYGIHSQPDKHSPLWVTARVAPVFRWAVAALVILLLLGLPLVMRQRGA